MGKWNVTKKDTLASGQLWESTDGGQRLILKIEDGEVWYWTARFPPCTVHGSSANRCRYRRCTVVRFSIWSRRLVQSGLDYSGYKHHMEVVNEYAQGNRPGG
jgi:hypothetical protein